MGSNAIVITGLGMVSSLGWDVVTSCAAARAGLSRWQELEVHESDDDTLETVPLKGHAAHGLADGFSGVGRWVRLGEVALDDLFRYAGVREMDSGQTGFILNLPGHLHTRVHLEARRLSQRDLHDPEEQEELRKELQARDERLKRVLPRLIALHGMAVPSSASRLIPGGPAAFIDALDEAARLLQTRVVERCVVGGIDSFVQGEPLRQVYELGLVRTLDQPTGFFPGEAAAFLLLERLDTARSRGGRIEAQLGAWAVTKGENDRFANAPPQGRGLSRVIQECLGAKAKHSREVALAIVNLNGDEFRAKEFGMALTHLASNGFSTDFRVWMPPEHFGEIGAATGAVSLCLGTRGLVRGYARSPALLIGLLGDDDSRGAALLEPAIDS